MMKVDVEVNVDAGEGVIVEEDVGVLRRVELSGKDQDRTIGYRTLILRSRYDFMFFCLLCRLISINR